METPLSPPWNPLGRVTGCRGDDSAWTYLELTGAWLRSPSPRPQTPEVPCALCSPSHAHHEPEAAKAGAGFSCTGRNFRGQVSPAPCPCLGAARVRTAPALAVTARGSGARGLSPGALALLLALPGLEARSSLAGAGRRSVPSRCGCAAHSFLLRRRRTRGSAAARRRLCCSRGWRSARLSEGSAGG